MRFKLFSEYSVGVEWCVRQHCNVFQPHRVVLALGPTLDKQPRSVDPPNELSHLHKAHGVHQLCIDINTRTSIRWLGEDDIYQ